MLGTSNQKVIPITEGEHDELVIHHDEIYDDENHHQYNHDDINHLDEIESLVDPMDDSNMEPPKRAVYRKQTFYSRFLKWYHNVTYDYIKESARWLMESASIEISISFEDIILLVTIYILFADDVKLLTTTQEVDTAFSNSYAFCFFLYLFEIMFNTWCKTNVYQWYPFEFEGYFLSFFWWADLISTLSICPDIEFISGPLGLEFLSAASSGSSNYTQAGRVVRLIRLVRLVRIYRITSERRARREYEAQLMELARVGAITFEEVENQRILFNNQKQSKLGKQLSESITRRVILMIIILLIVIPLLIYSPPNLARQFTADYFNTLNDDPHINFETKDQSVTILLYNLHKSYNNRYVDYLYMIPTYNVSDSPTVDYASNLASLRDYAQDQYEYNSTNSETGKVQYMNIIFSMNALLRQQAYMDIITTIFVAIMMIGGAVVFSNDAERLVIKPIERMMNLVEAVATNPLAQFSFEDDNNNNGNSAGQYETKLLESTIEKITGLLRVGFGEAGAGIISANLSGGSSSSTINPLLPGVRIYAMFGFCDIHHFEDINQKLSNDVLTFVNTIAEIVHESVHTWSGQCNKNLGNAFVIVWRIGDENTLQAVNNKNHKVRGAAAVNEFASTEASERDNVGLSTPSRKRTASSSSDNDNQSIADSDAGGAKKKAITVDLRRIPGVDTLADHALISYLKIIAEINRNKAVLKYRQEPRLTDNGKHEYKLRMGFGLHAGWAIEGAVGSIQKVDATYLSPHVNMAARLETSSRQYGVPLLASQDFYDLLSSESQQKCRRLDVVTVKGSEVPIGIYTYDCLQEQEFRDSKNANKSRRSTTNLLSKTMDGQDTPSGTQGRKSNIDRTFSGTIGGGGEQRRSGITTTPTTPGTSSALAPFTPGPPPLNNNNNNNSNGVPPLPSSSTAESKLLINSQSTSMPDITIGDTHHTTSATSNTNTGSMPPNGIPPLPPLSSNKEIPPMIVTPGGPGSSGNMSPQRRPSVNLLTSNQQSSKAIIFMTPANSTEDILDNDYDLLTLRAHVTPDFLETFKSGVNLYLAGEWITAKEILERADSMMLELAPSLGGDGPSKTLLNYMSNFDFKPPSDWHGYRPLTAK